MTAIIIGVIVCAAGVVLWSCMAMAGRQDEHWGDK